MSQTITAVPQYANAAALVRTVDGELWSDTQGPAPDGARLQVVADRQQYTRGALWGHLVWSGRFRVAGTSNTVFAVTIGAVEACAVCQSGNGTSTGTWRPHFKDTTTIGLAAVEGSPANLSADTWYYVYGYSDGTNLQFLINTTAPDASMIWQSAGGNPTRRYFGCFRTNASGVPLAMEAVRGRYVYRRSAIGSVDSGSGLRLLNRTTEQSSTTTLDLSARIPPHARVALLRAEAAVATADDADLYLYTESTDPSAHARVRAMLAGTLANSRSQIETEIPTLQSPASIAYALQVDTTSGSSLEANIHALGWVE